MVDRLKFACFWALWTRSLATYKGFVNPLRHYNASDGSLRFVLQLHDSESTEDLALAVQLHFGSALFSLRATPEIGEMKLWARLALLSITWAEVVLDRPDSQYKGGAENCTKLFVQSPPFDQAPHGLDQNVHPRSSSVSQNGDMPNMLSIRAVYYEPRPVGLSPSKGNDLYTSSFYHMHKRDLYIMRSRGVFQWACRVTLKNILKANAVRLAPWDRTQDHSRFLQLCRDEGLYVIPSFDLGAFLSEDARRMSTFGERRKDVWEQFQKFTQKALQDARKIEDIILMWTVNFGLNLNETTEEGPRSISVLSLIRDETGLQLA
eukprot:s3566_g7.t1